MAETSPARLLGPLIAVGAMLMLLTGYIAGYFLLGSTGTGGGMLFRVYDSPWQEVMYRPAAKVETMMTGRQVVSAHRSRDP